MLSRAQAQAELETTLPRYPIKAWTIFKDFYLFEIEHPHPLERDWDPFFSVDMLTGEVMDFPIMEITPDEHLALEWKDI